MSSPTIAVSLAAAMLAISQSALAQDAAGKADGQLAFNNACRTCHTLREGDNRLGPNSAQNRRPQGWSLAELCLFQRHESRRHRVGQGHARSLHRQSGSGGARAQYETLWRHRLGRGPCQDCCFSRGKRRQLTARRPIRRAPCPHGSVGPNAKTPRRSASQASLSIPPVPAGRSGWSMTAWAGLLDIARHCERYP